MPGRPARSLSGIREQGIRSAVGTPIIVEGRLWGLMAAGSRGEHALAADAEPRLASFTELLATTIANAESRAGVTRLAADQAALRRVATLVARAVPPEDVFAAVVQEIGRLLPVDFADLGRCEPDGTITFVAALGQDPRRLPRRCPVEARREERHDDGRADGWSGPDRELCRCLRGDRWPDQ